MLDWERFEVQLIVYFRNRYCRRWCGIRDGNFLRGLASSEVQAKSYRHRGEPGGNAYDCASHCSLLPVQIELESTDFVEGDV